MGCSNSTAIKTKKVRTSSKNYQQSSFFKEKIKILIIYIYNL